MNNKAKGKFGEELAIKFLEKQGYKIIETNRRFSRFCEIDVIALDRNTLVFVEVKTRTSQVCGHPLESITRTKYQHITTGVYSYIKENPQYKKYRIDAISIILKPEIKIEHLKNI